MSETSVVTTEHKFLATAKSTRKKNKREYLFLDENSYLPCKLRPATKTKTQKSKAYRQKKCGEYLTQVSNRVRKVPRQPHLHPKERGKIK